MPRGGGPGPCQFAIVPLVMFACAVPRTGGPPQIQQFLQVSDGKDLGQFVFDGGAGAAPASCRCDADKRLELTLKATCGTSGGLQVQITGVADVRVEQDLPAGEWRSVVTAEAVSFPRLASVADVKLFGRCAVSNDDIVGIHQCRLDAGTTCR